MPVEKTYQSIIHTGKPENQGQENIHRLLHTMQHQGPESSEHTSAFTHNAARNWGIKKNCQIARTSAFTHNVAQGNPINSYQPLHSMKNARPRLRPHVFRMRDIKCTYWFKRRRVWSRMSFNKSRNKRSADCWPNHVNITCPCHTHLISNYCDNNYNHTTLPPPRQPWQPRQSRHRQHRQQQWRRPPLYSMRRRRRRQQQQQHFKLAGLCVSFLFIYSCFFILINI